MIADPVEPTGRSGRGSKRYQSRSPEHDNTAWCDTCENYTNLVGCQACEETGFCEGCHGYECEFWRIGAEAWNDKYFPPTEPDDDDPPELHLLWAEYCDRQSKISHS